MRKTLIECEYETEDELAAILLTVHSNGTHMQTTSQPATQATAKVDKVWLPTVSSAESSEEWPYFLTRWKDYAEATTWSYNCLNVARNNFEKTSQGT